MIGGSGSNIYSFKTADDGQTTGIADTADRNPSHRRHTPRREPQVYTDSMVRGMLNDANTRRAYILTKLAVFAGAALATWPLATIIGPQAWWGLGVFGVVMLALSAAVLGVGRAASGTEEGPGEADEEALEPQLPVVLPVEDFLDLHPFAPRDIPAVVAEYLVSAHAAGIREVRLIHGRGIGVQRERVRSVLASHPLVGSFSDATPDRGGWGATVASLHHRPEDQSLK